MQQYPAIFLSVLCLWLFSKSTSSVPLDVHTKDKLKIILPQTAQSDNDIYQVEDNVEHGLYIYNVIISLQLINLC